MNKIFKSFIPITLGIVLSTTSVFAEQTFSDLTEEHWAYPQIQQLAKDGIVVGYPDGTYKPDENITRAEFASMAVKALKQQDAELEDIIDFEDVEQNNWAWENIQRAVRFDLIEKTDDNKFRPEESVTRAECLEIVINALTTEDISLEQAKEILEKKYTDTHTIPEWFIIKAAKAEVLGIIVTTPDNAANFFATKPATRAEIAAFLFNMIEQVKLAPNKKIAEVLKPIEADGIVIEDAIVKGNIGIIPAGTVIPAIIKNDLCSQTSEVSEVFEAKIAKNLITPQKYLLIKESATVKGILIDKKKALLIIRNGKLALNSKVITTTNDQSASFYGVNETNPKLSIWRKIFKGLKVGYSDGDVIPIKLIRTIKIDLTNSWIIE